MSNMKFIGYISVFYIIVSQTAMSLGLATTTIAYPDGVNDFGDISTFEMLLKLPIWALNSFATIMQLAFFQTDLPIIISSVVFVPPIYMLVYLFIVTVRGGAN